jgi:sialate O-acetylesterase
MKIPCPIRLLLTAAFLIATSAFLSAEVKLPALLSDHAVLQQSEATRIWGNAAPNEKIKVKLSSAQAQTTADSAGHWQVTLDTREIGAGPFDLEVRGSNRLVVHDVVVGEVWIASGQSNMESPVRRTDATDEEIAHSADAKIRQFKVRDTASAEPKDDVSGSWLVAGPETTGGFSAVAYYFQAGLREALNLPVGVINASWGGTPIEPWISPQAIDSVPEMKVRAERILQEVQDYPAKQAAYIAAFHAWASSHDREDHSTHSLSSFTGATVPDAGWTTVTLPGKISGDGIPSAGAVWLRKKVDLAAHFANLPLQVDVGEPHGFERVYWNGQEIGNVTPDAFLPVAAHHVFPVAPSLVRAGENVIAVRLYDPVGPFDDGGKPTLQTYPASSLAGDWLAKAEYELSAPDAEAVRQYPVLPHLVVPANDRPGYLHNAMIHPLVPYTMKGVIWYQGESNAGHAFQYRSDFPLLIHDWRAQWGTELPFYFCQLAGYGLKVQAPQDSQWAELREAQTMTLAVPKTGEAVLIDLGEEKEPHYRDKRDAGRRLALVALANTYGKPMVASGPVYDSFAIEGDKIRIKFREVGDGLMVKPVPSTYKPLSLGSEIKPLIRNSPNSEIEGLQICGDDHKWVWADARIEDGTVLVWSPSVPQPVAVRYAWADYPTVNLYNKEGLPAGPFRTDNFPGITQK